MAKAYRVWGDMGYRMYEHVLFLGFDCESASRRQMRMLVILFGCVHVFVFLCRFCTETDRYLEHVHMWWLTLNREIQLTFYFWFSSTKTSI